MSLSARTAASLHSIITVTRTEIGSSYKNMNILTIDYGKKRIGLAWVDTEVGVVLPFGQILNPKSEIRNPELITLIQREKVDKIVVGLPFGLDGTENENTQKVREFCDMLKSEVRVPIATVDERFSSAEADRMGGGVSRDEKAAMIILQAYLDAQK